MKICSITRQQNSFGRKRGRTMVAYAEAGHSKFLLKRSNERAKQRKNITAQVLPGLQGKGLAR